MNTLRWAGLLVLTFTSAAVSADRIVLVAGGGTEPPGTQATKVKLDGPFGVDFDSQGRMVMVEISGHRVMRADKDGMLTLVGGTGEKGNAGDGAPALKAQFNGMHSLAIGKDDAVYVADTWNNRVRRIDPKTGTITAFAGTGKKGDTGDGGPADKADLGGIYCIAFDAPRENLYLVDLDNRKVKKVNLPNGTIATVAGNGMKGKPSDGSEAVSAPLVDPRAVAISPDGLIYVLERGGHVLRVVDASGRIRTVVGTGQKGSSGDGGPALEATMNGPKHLCVDLDGTVLIADTENHIVRRYDPKSGQITRVAGSGRKGTAGIDGDPLQVEMFQPHGVWIGPDRNIYITDSGNHRVLKIERQ